jgi:hypothetical protein
MNGFSKPDALLGGQAHIQQALKLSAIDRDMHAQLTLALAQVCHSAGLQDSVLLLLCENGSVAAKLRQMAPRLVKGLNRCGHGIAAIRIRVNPRPTPAPSQAVKTLSLGRSARSALTELHAELKEGALKSAVAKLLTRVNAELTAPENISPRKPAG